jgi:hypothetical protein
MSRTPRGKTDRPALAPNSVQAELRTDRCSPRPAPRRPPLGPTSSQILFDVFSAETEWSTRSDLIRLGHDESTIDQLIADQWLEGWDYDQVPTVTFSLLGKERLGIELVEDAFGDESRWGFRGSRPSSAMTPQSYSPVRTPRPKLAVVPTPEDPADGAPVTGATPSTVDRAPAPNFLVLLQEECDSLPETPEPMVSIELFGLAFRVPGRPLKGKRGRPPLVKVGAAG